MAKENYRKLVHPEDGTLKNNFGMESKIDWSSVKSPNSQPKAEDKSKGNNTPNDKK